MSKEEQQAQKFAVICTPVLTTIVDKINEKNQQHMQQLSQEQTIVLQQEIVKMQQNHAQEIVKMQQNHTQEIVKMQQQIISLQQDYAKQDNAKQDNAQKMQQDNAQKMQQDNAKTQQDNAQKMQQQMISLQHDTSSIQQQLLIILQLVEKVEKVEKVVKSNKAVELVQQIEKVVKGGKITSVESVEVEKQIKLPLTASSFIQYALANEDMFGLRSKFAIINTKESALAVESNITVEAFRLKKDYNKKLGTIVWKSGEIQTDIKEIYNKWNDKKKVVVAQTESLEEDV